MRVEDHLQMAYDALPFPYQDGYNPDISACIGHLRDAIALLSVQVRIINGGLKVEGI